MLQIDFTDQHDRQGTLQTVQKIWTKSAPLEEAICGACAGSEQAATLGEKRIWVDL